jgi:hypothetical protein
MTRSTSRAVAYLTLALACFTVAGARAGAGSIGGGTLSPWARLSPFETVQAGECWEQNGPDGPGYYPCGDGGGDGSIIGPAIRRRNAPGLAGVHGPGEATAAHVGAPASPGLAGVHAPGSAAIPHVSAPASPGVAGATGAPHIASPGLVGVHAPGSAAIPHISAPSSPGLAGVHGVGRGGVGHR